MFLTALNYDEAGFIAGPLAALQWRLLRAATRRLSRRWRPAALRQVTGLQIMSTVVAWIGGVILGFGLIYYGNMRDDNFLYDGVHQGFYSALYFSAAQLSTVGTSQLTPNTDWLRSLSIAQTISGVVLVSLILTFLLGIYDVISSLQSLSSKFYSAERGAGDPISSLEPFFPLGQPTGLDSHLQAISDSFASYTEGLRLHHAAYYFQSGRDQFSLPYSLGMLSGVVASLRWGGPTGQLASLQPVLVPLTAQLDQFSEYIHPLLQWKSTDVPELLDFDGFERAWRASPTGADADRWVTQFAQLNHDMARLSRTSPVDDPQDTYDRYTAWLPFAYRMQGLTTAVSRDLDYQPIVVMTGRSARGTSGAPPVVWEAPDPGPAQVGVTPATPARVVPRDSPVTRHWHGWRTFLRDRSALIDPGFTRLVAALRALLSAVLAATTLVLVLHGFDTDSTQAAIFGGIVAMLTSAATGAGTGKGRRLTTALAVGPVVLAVLLTIVVGGPSPLTAASLALVALVGVWIGRYGLRWAILGQLAFIAYYFALLMHLQTGDLVAHILAGVVGVAWAFLLGFVVLPDLPGRVARDGVQAFERRLVLALDPLVDAVSWARWDPDVTSRVQRDMLQLSRSGAFLGGQLTANNTTLGLTPSQAGALRLRVFDLELAAVMLSDAARAATGEAMPIALRARLAGEIELLQKHLRQFTKAPRWAQDRNHRTGSEPDLSAAPTELLLSYAPPAGWPEPARRLHRSTVDLLRAADALHSAHPLDLDGPGMDPTDVVPDHDHAGAASTTAGARATLSPTSRRAIQAAVSTGLALSLGSVASTTHQYWAAMPAYQVLGGTDGETFVKATQRIIGTVVGAAIGFAVAIQWGSNHAVTLPLLALCVFASTYFRTVSSPLTTFWQTMLFAQLYEFLGKLSTVAVEVRILETVIGAVVALVVARLILPVRTRTKLNDDLTALVDELASATSASLHRLGGADLPVGALRSEGLAIDRQLRAVTTTAAPLRHASGALDIGGIEGELTAVWAMVFAARELLRAATGTEAGDPGIPAEKWARLTALTMGNLDALAAALRGDPQDDIPGWLDLTDDLLDDSPLTQETRRVLGHLQKLNETALLLLDDLVPGGLAAPDPQSAPVPA
ncbi:FUSC family protein [Sanguibacter gelidistatuariae]|uniref:FUSC family protein n=1 Tax=Sanguibacter gelidistatuariae TaxID=1814289 RepID=UPI000B84544B|nr:FUSC family protein [Sanguibacter gelidistatuariae]